MKSIYKKAYPVSSDNLFIAPSHDINIWIKTLREIYALSSKGIDFNKALEHITSKWDKMDQIDFKNWVKYYQSGADSVYKKAELLKNSQYFPATFLEPDELKASLPGNRFNENDIPNQSEKQLAAEKERLAAEKERFEKEEADQQIKALIGRLNSAERLATTKGIAKALGPAFENWVRALHELKKEIQVAPFRNVKSSLITDLIIRKGNQLYVAGHQKSAKIMYKIAQIAPPPLDPPPENPPTDPSLNSIPPIEPSFSPEHQSEQDAWVKEFLNGLEGMVDDKNDSIDTSADLYVDENDLKVFAQAVPQTPEQEVTEAISQPEANKLEKALSGITVDDVISKLEAVSNIFKNREISRQLAVVDIMMDQLGISSYFGELAEAQAKSLESNQYCGSRVEDVLARLKGSVTVPAEHALDLEGQTPGTAENNAVNLKNQLKVEEQKEKDRKKNREDLQNKTEDAVISNTPEVNTEALNQPAQIQPPQNPGVRV